MKEVDVLQNSPEWFEARRGTIGGSGAKKVINKRGTARKIGYYELLAERLAEPIDDEDPRMRGHRLEEVAIELLEEELSMKAERPGMWVNDDNKWLTLSPDGCFRKTNGIEVKCLKTELHLKAVLEDKVPSDYFEQCLQYFVVNDIIQRLYFVMFDPRLPEGLQFQYWVIKRESLVDEIKHQKETLLKVLEEVEEDIIKLTF